MSEDRLSDEDFINALADEPEVAAPEPERAAPEPAAAVEAPTPSEAEPTAEVLEAPAEPASEEVPAEPVEAAAPSIDPPHFWDATAKARFAQLPFDLQSVVLEQTKNGERAVTKSQEDAANARRAADEARTKAETEATSFVDLNRRLGEHITDKKAEFNERWKGWLAATPEQLIQYARENPDEYVATKAAFDAEQGAMQRRDAVKQEAAQKASDAETVRQKAWATSEAEKLRTYAPEFADPAKAPVIMGKLTAYGAKYGVTPDQIRNVDAVTLALAHKAMLYDELQANATKPAPRAPAPVSPPARPAAAPSAPPKNSAAAVLAKAKSAGRLSDDDFMATLNLT